MSKHRKPKPLLAVYRLIVDGIRLSAQEWRLRLSCGHKQLSVQVHQPRLNDKVLCVACNPVLIGVRM